MKKQFYFLLGILVAFSSLILSCEEPVGDDDGGEANISLINGHEAVDLGLPSGIKWATCNVGATKPEEYGGYYAWGETEEKEDYSWSTYKWCNGSYDTMTKYCGSTMYGTIDDIDDKTTLDLDDDVANVKWGGSWRMPTKAEQDELRTKCIWTWTSLNGVNGYIVTGPNGNSIFLPAAGVSDGVEISLCDHNGFYASSSLGCNSSDYAFVLYFLSGVESVSSSRNLGLSVRPVSE